MVRSCQSEVSGSKRDVAHLGREQALSAAVSFAQPLYGAFIALGAEYTGNFQLDQLLQGVEYELENQFTGISAIE